ncbi:MAG: radical SAM family heme chaperone HemW [Bacteroidales bacterium]|nr:radical SAM family heme chaperone HemW [Bacteroidales bacterium]
MAGIYLHIPFCKQKCAYCDFYSIVNDKLIEEYVNALCKEIELQRNFLTKEKIKTIYFGGGTPSLLSPKQLQVILDKLIQNFDLENEIEITLEANPDNLSVKYLRALKEIGINRLSVGLQSFIETDLQLMKRKHTVKESIKAIGDAQESGFDNISIDLIYGLPDLTISMWEENIEKALKLNVQHISAYHLTIEPNTLFNKYYQSNKLNLPTEDESLSQFKILKRITEQKGFMHYEISNFALYGFISLHNTNYWMGVKYLGLGPSAHSYNLTSRQWNIQNLRKYMDAISQGKIPYEIEYLTKIEKFNDFLITSLRTMWGLNTEKLKKDFGKDLETYFLSKTKKYIDQNLMKESNSNFTLTEKGIFISDNILQDFLHE